MLPPQLKATVGVVIAVTAIACSRGPEPVDFTDPLTGPVSPALSIPFDKYALTTDGLIRTNAESGTENGIERPVIRTTSGRYLSRDFVFEIDVTIPETHGDIAYVGFGAGQTNPLLDNEPSHAFLFRIHNLPRMPFYGIDATVADPKGGTGYQGAYRAFHRVGEYTPGKPLRVRIAHRGGKVTLSLPSLPGSAITFELAEYPDLFDAASAFVFLSNSSEGTTFRNASMGAN